MRCGFSKQASTSVLSRVLPSCELGVGYVAVTLVRMFVYLLAYFHLPFSCEAASDCYFANAESHYMMHSAKHRVSGFPLHFQYKNSEPSSTARSPNRESAALRSF